MLPIFAKDLRSQLTLKKASWKLADDVSDQTRLDTLPRYALGARRAPATAPTSRLPRMRRPLNSSVLRWSPDPKRRLTLTNPKLAEAGPLPKSWDWRSVGGSSYVSAPRDQGNCGSCVAFATTAAAEAERRILLNQPTLAFDLSESSLFFVSDRQCNVGDPRYGWDVPSSLDDLVNTGISFEADYPYRDQNQTAIFTKGDSQTFRINGYDSTSDTTQMKRWLVEDGPLVTTFTVYDDFQTFWSSGTGTYTHTTGNVDGGHAVLVIGFDDDAKAWICKNSWYANPHHSDACFMIGYDQCGINDRMYQLQGMHDVVTIDEIPYDPTKLRIVPDGSDWLLTEGSMRMKIFATAEDARNGLCVAKRYTRQGFVGRDNTRPNRAAYITEYWAGNSGLPWEPLTKTDAIPYSPTAVVAEDLAANGWRLEQGAMAMVQASDVDDALAVLAVIERYSRQCFIGRDNTRPNRSDYIMTYWE